MCRLSQCALGKVRKLGSAMMYYIKSELRGLLLSPEMRKMTVQMKVFHCIKIKDLNKTDGERLLNLQ